MSVHKKSQPNWSSRFADLWKGDFSNLHKKMIFPTRKKIEKTMLEANLHFSLH